GDVPVPNQSSIFAGTSELPSASQSVVLTELLQTREFLSKVGQNSPWAGYLAAHPGADGDRLLFQLAGDVSVSTPGPHVLAIDTKGASAGDRSEEHTSELQSHLNLVCRLLLEKKKHKKNHNDLRIHTQHTDKHTK